ncbi:DUF1643 domain-containing protein [Limnoglobus roseus]|uniref:DUF1643 domain-containing protein n=1 Tax=Limnoglobus roseus TaxID=2598579 RepID=A0A5C1ABC8_9BACT|nr:DUF1643 domain-containing protein [Limnoglobus roseus]QEL16679.1 hypothetical protein PX52LOC_03641 [Limnoglobus roseus]
MSALPLEADAIISACGRYRYVLTRQVGPGTRTAVFVMLNPSTADATTDDPTIRRCIGFARRWGCGRLAVLNLFAFRATDPADLKRAEEPVRPENRDWFERTLTDSMADGVVVCGWGVHGEHLAQDRVVLDWLSALGVSPLSLGLTKHGHPRRPLYLSSQAELIPFGAGTRVAANAPIFK